MKTKAKQNNRHVSDVYLELIQRFSLRTIKNDNEHRQAVKIIEELIGREIDGGASDYLDALIVLVNKYEDEHHNPSGNFRSPQDALKAIMQANNLSQAQIGKIIGSESAVSMFLKGDRDLSKAHIKAIVKRFRVDAGLFF